MKKLILSMMALFAISLSQAQNTKTGKTETSPVEKTKTEAKPGKTSTDKQGNTVVVKRNDGKAKPKSLKERSIPARMEEKKQPAKEEKAK